MSQKFQDGAEDVKASVEADELALLRSPAKEKIPLGMAASPWL